VTIATIVLYIIITISISNWRIGHRRAMNDADSEAAGLAVDALNELSRPSRPSARRTGSSAAFLRGDGRLRRARGEVEHLAADADTRSSRLG